MVGMIVLSLLGGGLFAQCAQQVLSPDNPGVSLALWAAGGGACFWALWTRRQAEAARAKEAEDVQVSQRQKTEELLSKLLGALEELTVQTAGGLADCKAGLSTLIEKEEALWANLPEKAALDAALEDISMVQKSSGLESRTLLELQKALEAFSAQATGSLADCRAGLSTLNEKEDALLKNLPEKTALDAALADASLIKHSCDLCSQTLAALQSALESFTAQVMDDLIDCKNELSSLDETASSLLTNQPESGRLEEALDDIKRSIRDTERRTGGNTEALAAVACQLEHYNKNYYQNLKAVDEQIQHILTLLANNYRLLKQAGEQYT